MFPSLQKLTSSVPKFDFGISTSTLMSPPIHWLSDPSLYLPKILSSILRHLLLWSAWTLAISNKHLSVFFLYSPKSSHFSKPLGPFHELLILYYFSLFLIPWIFSVPCLCSRSLMVSHYNHISYISPTFSSLPLTFDW